MYRALIGDPFQLWIDGLCASERGIRVAVAARSGGHVRRAGGRRCAMAAEIGTIVTAARHPELRVATGGVEASLAVRGQGVRVRRATRRLSGKLKCPHHVFALRRRGRRCSCRQAQAFKDRCGCLGRMDLGEDSHRGSAVRATQHVDREDALHEFGPCQSPPGG
jgi:hypothetical protein